MKLVMKIGALGAIACAALASQAALASDHPVVDANWANSAWYIGAGLGQTRSNIDDERIIGSLTANGESLSAFSADERDAGYKLFIGKQLNRYLALEAGVFDLGKFGFSAATAPNGSLAGQIGLRGVNLDLVGRLPLNERVALLARIGANYAEANTSFSGNRLLAVTDPVSSERKLNPKVGLGIEYKFSQALALRGEAERYRINDAVGNRGDVDMLSLSLVYKLGRPAPAPVVVAPPPEPVAAPVLTPPAPPAPPAPVPVSEKVSFAAEALFDFDESVVKPAGMTALDDLLGKLQGMDTEVMVTVGHTDAIGSDEYNQALSLRRAEAVKAYIVGKGVDATRVYTEGKGESQPVADNASAEGRAQNRRVTVEVVGTRTVMK